MGQPAARLSDMHVCPMATGLVPHVGGPIAGPCCPTVLIGGLPAARVSDLLVCVGPPDLIVMGSTGVFIGGMPAARLGDPTAHGGVIVMGWPTVLIGEVGGGGGGGGGGSSGGRAAGGGAGGGGGGSLAGLGNSVPLFQVPGPKVTAALATMAGLQACFSPSLTSVPDFRVAQTTPAMPGSRKSALSEALLKIFPPRVGIEMAPTIAKTVVEEVIKNVVTKLVTRTITFSVFRELRAQNMPAWQAFSWGKHFAKASYVAKAFPVVGIIFKAREPFEAVAEVFFTEPPEAKLAAKSRAAGSIAAFATGVAVGALVAVAIPGAPLIVTAVIGAVVFAAVTGGTKWAWNKWADKPFQKYWPW